MWKLTQYRTLRRASILKNEINKCCEGYSAQIEISPRGSYQVMIYRPGLLTREDRAYLDGFRCAFDAFHIGAGGDDVQHSESIL